MELEPLELAVLRMLLDGRHPVLSALRAQLNGLSVIRRERTGSGFFTTLSPDVNANPARISTDKLRFGDVQATIEGLARGAGFLLFVDNGLLKVLEGYSYEEPWPERVELFQLRYQQPDRSAVLCKLI